MVADVQAWKRRGERVAVATVVGVKRSAPRPPGAKMAVNGSGEVSGAVSGGCVEGAVVEAAGRVLAGGGPSLMHFGIADSEAWDVGLPCGGEIDVWVEEHVEREEHTRTGSAPRISVKPAAEFARLVATQRRGAVVAVVAGEGLGDKLLVRDDGTQSGGLGTPELDRAGAEAGRELMWAERSEMREVQGASLFVDATYPAPRLVVFGAVDYTAALCRLARAAGWRPYVCDPRSQFATPARFPGAEQVVTAWPGEAFEAIGGIDRATYVAVLTHDPKLDDAALGIALRSDAAYVGAMGSRRAQEARRERLLALGLEEDALDRLSAPIGLDLGAAGPEETALSIMAEVVAVRNGRAGGRLREKQGGRIHDVGERAQSAEPAASRGAGV
ncbi:MAG: XdhC family protein [Thermoleophilaceae bacterium]